MKAVIATDSISLLPLRGRHHPFTRPRAATLSVAITAYTIIWGNFAENRKKFKQLLMACRRIFLSLWIVIVKYGKDERKLRRQFQRL